MLTLQTKMDGFPQEIIENPEPAVIPFPCTGNLSPGQAADIFKYRMDDETVPMWAKVLAMEKIASFYNARTDKIVMEIEGYIAISNNGSNELVVTAKEGRTAGAYGDGGLRPSTGQVLRGSIRLWVLRNV